MAACSGDESRQRAAIIESLEDNDGKKNVLSFSNKKRHVFVDRLPFLWQKMHGIAWKQVNSFIIETLPTWCNSPSLKQKENASACSMGSMRV